MYLERICFYLKDNLYLKALSPFLKRAYRETDIILLMCLL